MPTPSTTNRQNPTLNFYGAATGTSSTPSILSPWKVAEVLLDCGLFKGWKNCGCVVGQAALHPAHSSVRG